MVFTAFIIEHNGTTDYGPSRPDRSNLGLNPEACRSVWVILITAYAKGDADNLPTAFLNRLKELYDA